jgi:protein O-GlcNAc transferase
MSFSHEFTSKANAAFALCQHGQFKEALGQTEALLSDAATNTSLLNLAGVCARAIGDLSKAEAMFKSAIACDPGYANAHCNLGLVLHDLEQLPEAETAFLTAISLQPNHVDALINLGNLRQSLHRPLEAEKAYRDALNLAPTNVNALYNFGLMLSTSGRSKEAEATLRKALDLQPNLTEAYNDLGNVLMDMLRYDEADTAYQKAIAMQPDFADAYCNIGLLLLERRRYEAALAAFRRCIEIEPGHPDALINSANLLSLGGHFIQAEEIYRVALSVKPDSANLHNNLGNLLAENNRLSEAESHYRRAVELHPDYGHALGQAITCARQQFDWSNAESDAKSVISGLEAGIAGFPSLMVLSLPEASPIHQKLAASLIAKQALEPYLEMPTLVDPALHRQHQRLRIGYLSADFHEHAVMHLVSGVLESHDRSQVEIHAYSTGPSSEDAYRKRVKQGCEHFHDLQRLDNIEAARQIANDEIDILVDLSGHTGHARPAITALRPAPIIVNWLGFPGTFGVPRMADYIIGDATLIPIEHAHNYTETLAWMPNTYQPNDATISASQEKLTREEAGLPDDVFVYCSFNQPYKLTPQMFALWCKLLATVPQSVLWLQKPGDESAIANLITEAAVHGISSDRLIFAAKLPLAQHLARLQFADLALDTFPYGSGATGSTIMRAGVPMITLMGDSYVSRMGASQLNAMGVPELITNSEAEYFNLAKKLALDSNALAALRTRMIANYSTSPLFDTIGFTRDLEKLYKRIWQDHANGIRQAVTEW